MKLIRIEQPGNPGPFHWSRKFFHMLGLLIPIIFYLDLLKDWTGFVDSSRALGVILIFGLALFIIVIDLIRFKSDALNQLVLSLFGSIMKDDEHEQFNAVTPYLISCGLLFLFCSREVVTLCCIFLMIGDPVAAYVGSRFGRIRFWNNKSMEGMLAFILAGFSTGLLFLCIHSLLEPESFFSLQNSKGDSNFPLLAVVLLGATFAAVAEFFSSIHLRGLWDDNLLVPLGATLGIIFGAYLLIPNQLDFFLFDPNNLFRLK